MKSGEGGLGSRREGVVGEVGVCDAVGLRGAELCWGVFAPELLPLSDMSTGFTLLVVVVPFPGILDLLPVPAAVPDLFCAPMLVRVPLRLRKW